MTEILERYNLELCAFPAQHGAYINARNFATYDWAEMPETPTIDGEYVCDYGERRLINYWTDGAFRYDYGGGRYGNVARFPQRWARIRLTEEKWDGAKWVLPDGSVPPVQPVPDVIPDGVHMDAEAGQRMVDELKRSFTVNEINRMLEASPYDEPDQGAPME